MIEKKSSQLARLVFPTGKDFPDYGLHRGDIGAVVHSYKNGAVFEVEFVTGEGGTIAVITLEANDVRSMNPSEILHARERKAA